MQLSRFKFQKPQIHPYLFGAHALACFHFLLLYAVIFPLFTVHAATFQLDTNGMDASIKPGDSFFNYVNGTWIKQTAIPADRSSWGVGQVLEEKLEQQTADLLKEASQSNSTAGPDEIKAADFFAAYMDENTIESRGLVPLLGELEHIYSLNSVRALSIWLGEQLRADVDPLNDTEFHTSRLFGLWVSPDMNNPVHRKAYLLQGGLGMPDREYYLEDSERMKKIRERYQAHISNILRLAKIPDPEARAARIFQLETAIAKVHASREDSEDVQKANNLWRRTEFSRHAPGIDWPSFFRYAWLNDQSTIYVWQPGAIKGISALITNISLATWKDYAAFHAIDRHSHVLPKAFVDESFDFYGKTLSGTPELSLRWKRAVRVTNAKLPDAVGRLYVSKYFPPESKARVTALVKNLVQAFGARIDHLDWMSPETKIKAKEKLSTLYVGVGYPEKWISYDQLQIKRDDALGNIDRAELIEYRRRLTQLHRGRDESEWWMPAQIVDAVNVPLQNAINFPAGILQPPYFDPAAPDAVNYGSIGATIGHEISHSFDDEGAKFDAHGKLTNWFTPDDLAHFQKSGAQLASQFDAYHPFPDLAVKGQQTLSENIADLAGLAAAHDAWMLSLEGKPAPTLQGLTGEQQFFISYALGWQDKAREAALRKQIITDGHAPPQYRVETVRNLDPWYSAFDVQPGQTLYLAPTNRVRVW